MGDARVMNIHCTDSDYLLRAHAVIGTREVDAPDAHVWFARTNHSWMDASVMAAAEAIISSEERERADRLFRIADRQAYLAARLLVRRVLAHYVGGRPEELCFEFGPSGRPELARQSAAGSLRFNLSHTRGLAVCAVAHRCAIGVDVEDVRREVPLNVAASHFGAAELAAMNELAGVQRADRFFQLWTLKEAFLKARGVSIWRLEGVNFDVDAAGGIQWAGPSPLPASWEFRSFRICDHYQVGLALQPAPSEH